jgi:sucrose phosphorylase
MKNQVQLITYVDRLGGGDLRLLQRLLSDPTSPLAGLFGGVHLLPFFHPIDGTDAGFDPIDHQRVDQRLGSWTDVKALSAHVEIMADVIVNHVSSQSPQFLDWSARGSRSPHAGMFLTRESIFPRGASAEQLQRIYRPRPGSPFTEVRLANGETKMLWTTFTPQQVDIDVEHPQGAAYLEGILRTFADAGIASIRMDAVGYAIKRAGTSCFMLPDTFKFIAELTAKAHAKHIEVLVEVHSYYQRQVDIAKQVDWVYDFALPPLVLHALTAMDLQPLVRWMGVRPTNALTVLDTHDGIGIIDIGADAQDRTGSPGLVEPAALDALVERIHQASRGESRRATGAAASNLDLYQVNCTFFDALGRDERAYLIARTIQFFLPGVPQVYYVGLLAGENDMALLERSGVGRDINRHHYSVDEIAHQCKRPVVKDQFDLIRLRNRHPAFQGRFECHAPSNQRLQLRWRHPLGDLAVDIDVAARTMRFDGLDQPMALRCFEGGVTSRLKTRAGA